MVDFQIEYTPNYQLALMPFDYPRWQDRMNDNLRVMDALLAKYVSVLNVKGVWANSTVYAAGDVAVDADEGQLYRALSQHTSPGAPTTFAEYRTDNPGVWTSASIGVRARGDWQTGTAYALGDFVVSDNIFATCVEAHTSGTVFLDDEDKWSYLIDLRSVTELKAITETSSDYSFVATDANKMVKLTGSTGRTFTIPPEATLDVPVRTEIFVSQWGTGALTIAPGSGVSIVSEFSWRKLNAQYSVATLLKTGPNEWLLTGSLRP